MAFAANGSLTDCQDTYHRSQGHSAGWAERLGRKIRLWHSRISERRSFASFDNRDLHDLGMSRWELERELSKPFWRG
jgi:uncharacterized protein YjiS (DUF1127 family)